MSEDGEIVLPPGTRYVTVEDIPRNIAYALYPEFTGDVTVDFIRKIEVTELGVRNRTLELTPQDWERLREIWAALPPFQAGMSESTWLPYAEAAAATANLGWRVVPFTKYGPLGTAMLRAAAEERHSEHLKQAIREGSLTTYDHARLPNPPAQAGFPDARVKVADFATYVEAFNLRVRVMPSGGVIEAKWVIGDLVTEEAAQSYTYHGYAGQTEADKTATLSRIERNLYNDVFALVQVGAITPIDSGSGVAVDPKAVTKPEWRLTREDVETFLRFAKFTSEGKRDFLLDRKRRQNEGRYTLKRAAMLLARAGERYTALLTRLASAAEAEEIPTYAPGLYQRLQYGSKPGQQTRVRDWYEEVYWGDLNRWLETHEPRIVFRFPNPAVDSSAAGRSMTPAEAGLTCLVNGREAVPVRAIPFVSGWMQSPDAIAGDLAKRIGAPFSVLREIEAYHVYGTTIQAVLPKEWDEVRAQLQALEARLRREHPDDPEGYAAWRNESAQLLPSCVFVWRDEYERELGHRRAEGEVTRAGERNGDFDLNYQPMIAQQVGAMVMDGFERFQLELQSKEESENDDNKDTKRLTSETEMNKQEIDWAYWLALREVKAWQAVLLSLGLDPDSMEHSRTGWMHDSGGGPYLVESSFPDRASIEEYKKRLRLLLSNISDRRYFSPGSLSLSRGSDCGFRLREVAAWLMDLNRNPPLPNELAKAAARPEASTGALTAENADVDMAGHANDSAFRRFAWQLPLRRKGLELLDKDPKQKLDALATQLVSIAEQMGFKNRSGKCLDAATIRRHALLGIQKEHKGGGAK